MQRKVKERLAENPFSTEQEGDEQAPQAPVSVKKRMDGLELDVRQCRLEQGTGTDGIIVKEFFQGTHAVEDSVRRRRDETGIPWTAATDPVLRATELAGLLRAAPSVSEQAGMDVPQEPQGKRRALLELVKPVLHGLHIAGDLGHVVQEGRRGAGQFVAKEIGK